MKTSNCQQVDPSVVRDWASVGCTIEEISQFYGVSRDYIEKNFLYEYQQGLVKMRYSLRRMQHTCGFHNKGNAHMLIWLGKMYLHQKEEDLKQNMALLDRYYEEKKKEYECQRNLAQNSSVPSSKLLQDTITGSGQSVLEKQ